MATTISDVVDLFTSLIRDYNLDTLYNTSGSANYLTYIEPWLLYAVDQFSNVCTQTLSYSTTTQVFSLDLTTENQLMLARMMVRYWLQKELQDIQQMRLHLQDRDFKTFSEAQNLGQKQALYNSKIEEISQLLVDYSTKHNDWTSWGNQDFSF